MDNKAILSGFIWRFLERCGAQGITLVVSIILARLLSPEIYGTVSLILVFLTILEVFVDSGLGNALIQKKDSDYIDFSSVFYSNVIISLILYWLMWFAAPVISNFYNLPELVLYIRVLSLNLIIAALKNIQVAYVSKYLLFQKFFLATLIGSLTSGVVGISLAYAGFGVWAIIGQSLSNSFFDTIALWFFVKWRPRRVYSFERFKRLFAFAWKLLATNLIDTIYQKIRQLIIGKVYSAADLAFYNQGQQIPYAIISNINTAIDSVLLPAFSSVQDNIERVKQMTRRSISTSVYIITPLLLCLYSISQPLVAIVLTEKWLPCVFFLRVSCIAFIFTPINTANINAIKALGRSDLVLKLEIIKKIVGIIVLIVTMFKGVKAIAIGLAIVSFLGLIINAWPNRKLLGYGYYQQLKDVMPAIILSSIMALIIYYIQYLDLNNAITIFIQIVLGLLIYIIGSKLFRIDGFLYLTNLLKSYARKEKQ